jgi:two-component system nitrogen regulation sensor histidine kinase NtrY
MQAKWNITHKILIVLATICALLSFLIFYFNKTTTKELAVAAQNKLQQKESLAQEKLVLLTEFLKTTKPKKLFTKYQGDIAELYKKEGIAIYVYENDSLCFWSDNEPAIDLYSYALSSKAELIKIRNGWFECITQKDSIAPNYKGIALIAIKNEYDLENKYIQNNFSDWLDLPDNTKLKTDFDYLNPAIKSKWGNTLFEISRNDGVYKSKMASGYATLFALVAGLILLLIVFYEIKRLIRDKVLRLVVFGLVCLLLRTLMIYFKWPSVFYETRLFDASIFADGNSFYFSYLGDVLINSFLILVMAVMCYKTNFIKHIKTKSTILLLVTTATIVLIYYSISIRNLIYSLVNNSTINYNINELFDFTGYSLIGLLSVGFMLYSFYILCEELVIIVLAQANYKLAIIVYSMSLYLVIYLFVNVSIYDYLWILPLALVSLALRKYKASYNFINIGLIVLVATITTSNLFNKYEQKNKQQTYDALSFSLTDRQDIIAENEFTKVISSLKMDSKLKNLVSLLPLSSEQIEQSIRQVEFSGYFERYDITLALFKNDGTPVFNQTFPQYLNEEYFKKQIKIGSQTISDELYFIDQEKKPIRYVAKIEIESGTNNPEDLYNLYVQMEPKNTSNLGAFPDLLLDKSLESKLETKKISYAVYENNKLERVFGDYQYPIYINNKNFSNYNDDGYSHYNYENKKNTKVIISEVKSGVWQRLTSMSYLFIFFSVIVFCSILFNSIVIKRQNDFNSLNYRIQFILVSIVFLSLTGVVYGTIWVVESQFEIKNKKELITKSQLVLKELVQTVGKLSHLDPAFKVNTTFTLKKLSQLFGSDISIFNEKGILYSSSQPTIYDQGLISKFMNPVAYASFMKEAKASYSQRETIGSLNYLSAYIPFYNSNDQLIGFINLPYFSRQKDLENEIAAYLTTLINIYTILFAITTLVALLVSNLLTKPLRMIKQQISNIKFGTHNEALEWPTQDEIGDLVNEYNAMLIKLEKSSRLLAQSERESAWREMAKQVAHEIKNPLTPMKLNIQHLQRVVATHPEDINERVNKVASMLIEQIDTLSHIATEFSSFAKLPVAHSEKINLYEVLQNITNLFQQNTDFQITLSAPIELYILADRDQCIRIFTNLLKNAEQAIPADRKGLITINAFVSVSNIIVVVKDNGSGIEESVKDKLFIPNFTTKTTGTGLGLAMVKNSVEMFNGTITFETQVNKGTNFTLSFPKEL